MKQANYNGPRNSDEAFEWRQSARDKRLEKLERQRTNGEFDWDPDEEFYEDEESDDE